MFKAVLFATALVAVEAWERDVKLDDFKTEAYGVDNQQYGHQGYGGHSKSYGADGHGNSYGHGASYGNASHNVADDHNSIRQGGHQGQGHNQWVDNAWNQWGTNNHFDTQKSVDNKWGNQSGKINVTVNSVSGHYDADYGHQQRGLGYEGHQNTSGDVGYVMGMGGHSYGYAPGKHSYGYKNTEDYGYGGWANNLGAWNHGANYDNFGDQHVETGRDQDNDSLDTHDIKENRRVGFGYGDIEELDAEDDRQDQFGNYQIGRDNKGRGTGTNLNVFSNTGRVGRLGAGVKSANYRGADIYDAQGSGYGIENGYGSKDYGYGAGYGNGYGAGYGSGYGVSGYGSGYGKGSRYGGYGGSYGSGYGGDSYGSGYGRSGYGSGYGRSGYGSGYGRSGYGSGNLGYGESRPLGGSFRGQGKNASYGYSSKAW